MGRKMPRALGWHWDSREPTLDDSGRPTCRWCKGKVNRPRRSYCSDECSFQWDRRIRWRVTREYIFGLRRGICEKCGIDLRLIDPSFCEKQWSYALKVYQVCTEKDWRKLTHQIYRVGGEVKTADWWRDQHEIAMKWSADNKCLGRSVWDLDHHEPVAMGGDWFSELNLRLLCVSCHRAKTREDQGRIKAFLKSKENEK